MPTDNSFKAVLRRIVPAPLWSALNALRPSHRRWRQEHRRQLEAVAALEAAHRERNAGAAANEIRFRADLVLKVHPASRESFEYFCFRDPAMVREMDCFIACTAGRSQFLDIGALHGVFSLVFAASRTGARIVAVDASPLAVARLRLNVDENRLVGIVTPVECALSNREGSLQMHYEWEHAVAAPPEQAGGQSLEVRMTTGDSLCQSLAFAPDTIKIDVEGHEVKVLEGLRATLARCRPLIFLEVHPARILAEGAPAGDILRFLGDLGYTARNIDGAAVPLETALAKEDRLVLSAPNP